MCGSFAAVALMGETYMGLDMGEQDVRYLWGYAGNTVLAGPGDHFEQYLSFRDYSWQIEWQSGGKRLAHPVADGHERATFTRLMPLPVLCGT